MIKTLKKHRAPYLFILPFFILFFIFQLIPTLWTFYISFTNWNGTRTPEFCGAENYKKLLVDDMFWEALCNTMVYWVTGLVVIMILSLFIASILTSKLLRGRVFFKTIAFLPNICAAIAMGLIFRMLFDENTGLVNAILVSTCSIRIPWLTSTTYSKIPVIILNIWRNTPWYTMIMISGLLGISPEYYEAATIDGAGKWKQFIRITLPCLGNILFFCSVTLTVDSWKLFNESYILPGPGTSNTSLFQYMYESGFNVFNMGYAATIGVILILILSIASVMQMAIRKKQGEL